MNADDRAAAAGFVVVPLADEHVSAVVALCRVALDLPDDAAEAADIVLRLREQPADPGARASTGRSRRLVGHVALRPAWPSHGHPDDPGRWAVIGVALGSVAQRDPTVGHVDLVAVHPAARRAGIARALLARTEAALAAGGVREVLLAGNPPCYAWPGIDVRYTAAICVALVAGYEHDRTAWNMTVDLAAAPLDGAGPEPAGVLVHRAGPADVPALVAFVTAHFGPEWAAEAGQSVDRERAGCYLARRGDELLGFAAYGSSRPSWFGPMGTVAAAQGLGIGGLLLRRCLAEQRDLGLRRAEIGWVGPVPFYSRVAQARIERVFFLYRKSL